MVVYVFTKKELSKSEEVKTVVSEVPCVCETVEVNNNGITEKILKKEMGRAFRRRGALRFFIYFIK